MEWTSNGETGRHCKGTFAQKRQKKKYSDSRRAVKAIDNEKKKFLQGRQISENQTKLTN